MSGTDIFTHFLRLILVFRVLSMFNLQNSIEVISKSVHSICIFLPNALGKPHARLKLVVVNAVVWSVAEKEVFFVTLRSYKNC